MRGIFVFGAVFIILSLFTAQNSFAAGSKDKEKKEEAPKEEVVEPPPPPPPPSAGDLIWGLLSEGKSDEAETLFVSSKDVNLQDKEGRSALHMAAEIGDAELADFFLRLGTAVDAEDKQGRTALNIAAERNDAALAQLLVSYLANIYHTPPHGTSPALQALRRADARLFSALLTDATIVKTSSSGGTILHLAADEGNARAVDEILFRAGEGSPIRSQIINKMDNQNKTPADLAFAHRESERHAECAQKLISAGGTSTDPFYKYLGPAVRDMNFNLRSDDGISPLYFAVRERYTGFTRYLLNQRRANPNIQNDRGRTPLHEAARTGDMETVNFLLSKGARADIKDSDGNTPMHEPIPPDVHEAILATLLAERGVTANIRNANGDTPLHVVVSLGRDSSVIRVLLNSSADVSVHNNEGKTPLFLAVENKREALISPLLDAGSDIFSATNAGVTPFEKMIRDVPDLFNALVTNKTVAQTDSNGNTLLILAVEYGSSVDLIRRILEKNANYNARNKDGNTALHTAVRLNAQEAGDLLITRGADVFAQNSQGDSPVRLTFYNSDGIERTKSGEAVREWMLNQWVLAQTDTLGETVLHLAAKWKLDSMVPLIVDRGGQLEAKNSNGETPLFVAVKINSAPTIRALVNAGASIASRDWMGNTALHAAVRYNAYEAAKELIADFININDYNLYGKTPLHDTVEFQTISIERLLLESKADTEVRDNDGNTPLMEAISLRDQNNIPRGNYQAAVLLIEAGADVSTRNSHGDTPLHIAVTNERSDMVALLLQNNAQIHAQNAEGESPFTIALAQSPRMVYTLLTTNRAQTSDDEGRSPLHIAIMRNAGREQLANIVQLGSRISAVDRAGRTPLRAAIDSRNWAAAKYLVENGADVFSVARDGKTPAEVVLSGGQDAIQAVFTGKAITSRDPSGNTVLHYAARINNPSLTAYLLELGANRGAANTAGEKAYDIAERWGNRDVANLLR